MIAGRWNSEAGIPETACLPYFLYGMICRDGMCTTSDRYVKILDLRGGNEKSSEETTGCEASVYEEFDDCPRVEKYVKLFGFRHSKRFFRFDQSAVVKCKLACAWLVAYAGIKKYERPFIFKVSVRKLL